ncbi:solute carrier family 28 member 3-like [Ciona intestinalis]
MGEKEEPIELEECDLEKGEKLKLNHEVEPEATSQKNGKSCIGFLLIPVLFLKSFYSERKTVFKYIFLGLLLTGYVVYFIIAIARDPLAAKPLIILTLVILFLVLYELRFKKLLFLFFKQIKSKVHIKKEIKQKIAWFLPYLQILLCIAFCIWLLVDMIMRNPSTLISVVGFIVILVVCICASTQPKCINWRPVIWGIGLQFILGLIVLRTSVGYTAIKFIGDQIATFMKYTDSGSIFVFGYLPSDHVFAFKVLPMIVFFSMVTNMLFYVGLMQWFIAKLAYLTQITLGTSAIESAVAIANIFVGMTEAPLIVRPYLPELTKAEIHSVLTTGLASISFSVFGVYIGFGVDGVHLLTACVMSAPAGLVVSRLLYPEVEKSKFMNTGSLALSAGTNRNIVEAAAAGASMSIKLVANIGANLIAFLALLAFINATLHWFGAFVGIPQLSFEVICSYLFMPVAFLMGADWEDCFLVGQLFGMKTFLNEFIAYETMKPFIHNRLNQDVVPKFINGTIQYMSERSEMVAIHALCGFCNVSSLGIIIGGLSVLMPNKKKDLADMSVRALMGGMIACCMTASISGMLFVEPILVVTSNITATPSP